MGLEQRLEILGSGSGLPEGAEVLEVTGLEGMAPVLLPKPTWPLIGR